MRNVGCLVLICIATAYLTMPSAFAAEPQVRTDIRRITMEEAAARGLGVVPADAGLLPSGGGVAGGSCVGFCGTNSPGGCWCDEACCVFSDCCADKQAVCGGCGPGGGSDCEGVPPPPNDNCEAVTPVALTQGVPVTFNGDNTCATNQCDLFWWHPGHVFEAFKITKVSKVTLDYCGSGPPVWNNAWLVLLWGCPCTGYYTIANSYSFSCPDGNLVMTWSKLTPATYYYPVMFDPVFNSAGAYTITVVAEDAPHSSCVGACGGWSGNCWCDEACCTFANCCADKNCVCGGCGTCPGGPGECPGELDENNPLNGVVDARQPRVLGPGGGPTVGLGSADEPILIDLGPGNTGASIEAFKVCVSDSGSNKVKSLIDNGDGTYHIVLVEPIQANTATTISYGGGGSICLIYHPANVDADATAGPADVLRIVDILNGVFIPPHGIYSTDIDRSGLVGPPDVLRTVDLLNGAGALNAQLGTARPNCVAVCSGGSCAFNPNSCVGNCGFLAGNCFCDEACCGFSDCCADKQAVCGGCWPGGGDPNSCVGACGGLAGNCWCDEACCGSGDCCADNLAVCGGCGPDSCQGLCGGLAGNCWCDELCCTFADCCPNKQAACGGCSP